MCYMRMSSSLSMPIITLQQFSRATDLHACWKKAKINGGIQFHHVISRRKKERNLVVLGKKIGNKTSEFGCVIRGMIMQYPSCKPTSSTSSIPSALSGPLPLIILFQCGSSLWSTNPICSDFS